jgi:lipopolysaccharide transport system ATP-binding protein
VDVPVKRYSSGMFVRLAFAVAAHLDTDVLLADEVLAVGDARFQARCLGRMREAATAGRTVLLVSHDMNAVGSLCTRILLLEDGRLKRLGPPSEVISEYLSSQLDEAAHVNLSEHRGRAGGTEKALQRVTFHDHAGRPRKAFPAGDDIYVTLDLDLSRPVEMPVVGIGLCSELGHLVAIAGSFEEYVSPVLPAGPSTIVGTLKGVALTPGFYSLIVDLRSSARVCVDRVEGAASLAIEPSGSRGTAWLPASGNRAWICPSSWSLRARESR